LTTSLQLGISRFTVESSDKTEVLDPTDIRSESINHDGHVGNSERTVGDFLSIPPRPLTKRDKVQTILNNKPEVLTGELLSPHRISKARAEVAAIVKHRTHQRGQLGYLYITSINLPDSITIAIHPPPSNDEQSIDLKFDPPVEDGFEVRTRLSEWRDKAFEHFDVVRPSLYMC
jgi:hypothetical protein